MPVGHHVGTLGKHTICLQTNLARIGRPFGKAFRLRLNNEKVLAARIDLARSPPNAVSAPVKAVLRWMIDVDAGLPATETPCNSVFIHLTKAPDDFESKCFIEPNTSLKVPASDAYMQKVIDHCCSRCE